MADLVDEDRALLRLAERIGERAVVLGGDDQRAVAIVRAAGEGACRALGRMSYPVAGVSALLLR
jgi:hypothetical protein